MTNACLSKGKFQTSQWISFIFELHLVTGNHSTPEYTKNLSKCLKFSLAYQKMGYPADFRGFVEDLPEHLGLDRIMELRDISAKSYIFTTLGSIDSS